MKIALRLAVDLLLVVSFFYLPWWLAGIMSILATVYFRNFFEVIVLGFMVDIYFGVPRARLMNFQYVFTVLSIIIFVGVHAVKSSLRRTPW